LKTRNPRALGLLLLAVGMLVLATNGVLPSFVWLALTLALGAVLWLGLGKRVASGLRLVAFIALGVVATATSGAFAGATATAFIALGFILTYGGTPGRWWAILPGGIMASVTLMLLFDLVFPAWGGPAIMFLGFAATFTYLYLLPRDRGGKLWALYPAVACIALTVVANDPRSGSPDLLLPLVLIGSGALILWWWRRKERE